MDSRPAVAVIYNTEDFGGDAVIRGMVDCATEARDTITALGHRVGMFSVDVGVGRFVEALEAFQPDVVLNLCEGFRAWSAGHYCVAGLLELLGIPYTGSGPIALGIALDKPLSKEIFIAREIPTPRFAVYREMPARLPALTFPLILKLAREDASIGLTADNVVSDEASALVRLQQLLRQYDKPVLVEEFIDGREFTVALVDGQPLPVEEIEFHVEPRIVSFRAKWQAGSTEHQGTTAVFAPVMTHEQREAMTMLAVRVWEALGMRDYARVDLRMDACGCIYVLEANPNPDISRGSGYRQSLETAQISYSAFLARLLENAVTRTRPASISR